MKYRLSSLCMDHVHKITGAIRAVSLAGCLGYLGLGLGLGLVPYTAQAQKLRLSSGGPQWSNAGTGAAGTASATAAAEGVRPADYIVAIVNSEPLTNNEVRTRLTRVQHSLAAQGAAAPSREVLAREVLERLILEKILLQQARELGVRVDDYALDQAEQSVARQNELTLAQMHQRLRADGMEPKKFREELRQQMLVQRLRERELDSRVRVSDVEVQQYLQEQESSAEAAASFAVNLGHILVTVPEDASPATVQAAQARATEAADKLRAPGADLAALARQYSEANEAQQGGQLGLRPAQRYPELFIQALGTAGVGAVIGPVRSPAGFHVLKVLERTQASGLPALVTQNHARHILLRPSAQLSENAAAQRLADYRRRVVEGHATFEALAREHSQDGSAKEGGDLGWATPGRYVPEFEQVLAALKPGEISAPVASRFGVHLIQLVERREVPLSARERHDLAKDAVREKKLEEAYGTWTQEQRARAYVEYREAPQ